LGRASKKTTGRETAGYATCLPRMEKLAKTLIVVLLLSGRNSPHIFTELGPNKLTSGLVAGCTVSECG